MSCTPCLTNPDCPPSEEYHFVNTPCCVTGQASSGGGGGGGGGGSSSDATIVNPTITGGTMTGTTLASCTIGSSTLANSTITSATITNASATGLITNGTTSSGGTYSTPTITNPTVTTGTFSSPVITTPTITGGTITGLGLPSAATDAATKAYVDAALTSGLLVHDPCRVATTGSNITLAGGAPNTLDGVTLVANDRILVKDQTDKKQNGIYEVATLGTGSNGTWTRTADANSGSELETNSYTFVQLGTANASSSWVVTSPSPVTIGSSDIIWSLFYNVVSVPATSITGQLISSQIQDAAINTAKFAASIRPVELVSSLPSTGNFAGRIVFLTTDYKLYRHTGSPSDAGGFTAAVPAVDVTGTFGTTSIEDDAITAAKLSTNSVTAAKITAGAVVAGKIAANAVTANELAANSVTAAKILAGTITGDKITANTITSGLIQAGAISTTELAADAVTADKIYAGAVTTPKILAGAVTAAKISVVDLSSISANIGTITAGNLTSSAYVDVGTGFTRIRLAPDVLTFGFGAAQRMEFAYATGVPQFNGYGTNNRTFSLFSSTSGISDSGSLQLFSYVSSVLSIATTLSVSGLSSSSALQISGTSCTVNSALTATGAITYNDGSVVGGISAGSGRLNLGSTSSNTLALRTAGTDRFYIGTDGHLKSNGGDIRKASTDGKTVPLFDGDNSISFAWTGGQLRVYVDGTDVGYVQLN